MNNVRLAVAGAIFANAALVASATNAAVVIDFTQVGSNVVVNANGTLDLAGLTSQGNFSLAESVRGNVAYIGLGNAGTVMGYLGLTGPASFGTGNTFITANSFSGTSFALNGSAFGSPYVFVPAGYASGSAISGTATFLGQTFASLGLTAGRYGYTSRADTVTVNIGGAVPEPSTWAMMLLGIGGIGMVMRRSRKQASATLQLA